MTGMEKSTEQMLGFLKASWEGYLRMMQTLQTQTEKVVELMLNQGEALQEESKQMLEKWVAMMKQAQDQYQKMMTENLKKMESMFSKE